MKAALAAFAACVLAGCVASPARASDAVAVDPENATLATRAGLWDVTETVWATPTAAPVTTVGHLAERRVVGVMLQEILRPPADPNAIERIDYLRFNHAEGRWDYVSMDTRAPVGIMPAWSFTRGDGKTIALAFSPFALPTGVLLRMDEVITFTDRDHDVKDQHFIQADGTGIVWLAHRYAYARHPG